MNTKEFIEKVSKAKEIQALWKPKAGDWIVDPEIDYTFLIFVKSKEHIEHLKKWDTWLPTLEQLFGIAVNEWNKEAYYKSYPHEILADFIDWVTNTDANQYKGFKIDYFNTIDCFLIYIMETYFKKVWNGKDWEGIE